MFVHPSQVAEALGEVLLCDPGTLRNDGKVIEDPRRYESAPANDSTSTNGRSAIFVRPDSGACL